MLDAAPPSRSSLESEGGNAMLDAMLPALAIRGGHSTASELMSGRRASGDSPARGAPRTVHGSSRVANAGGRAR